MSNLSDKIKQFTQRVKFVKGEDVVALFPMVVGFIAAQPTKLFHKNLWLICERKGEARDNGYWFFKYMCENHPEIETVYAIDNKAIDYDKVAKLGKVIQFGSLKHWIYYFAAKKNISSQKEGKPNAALCYILEVYLGARKNRVYLKHGIVKDAQRWIYYDVSKLNLMCCAAQREHDFIMDNFGYPKERVVLTGLCRFDNLLTPHQVKRQILVMPTMREWLRTMSSDSLRFEKSLDFRESEYFTTWKGLIENKELAGMLEEYNVDLLFYPHPAMQKYIDEFKSESKRIVIANAKNYDMQQLLMESAMLITDYSSIYFDFAYMLKPLVYYQFDYEKYRRGQYQEGYFSYERDGFGPVVNTSEELLSQIRCILMHGIQMPEEYCRRAQSFYAYHDTNNCKRTYQEIIKMG